MKIIWLLIGMMGLAIPALGAQPPYDKGEAPFVKEWCAPPYQAPDLRTNGDDVFDQSAIKEICSGSVIIEGDMLFPGARILFKNKKTITIGCASGWAWISDTVIARECVTAFGAPTTIILYEAHATDEGGKQAIWGWLPYGQHFSSRNLDLPK